MKFSPSWIPPFIVSLTIPKAGGYRRSTSIRTYTMDNEIQSNSFMIMYILPVQCIAASPGLHWSLQFFPQEPPPLQPGVWKTPKIIMPQQLITVQSYLQSTSGCWLIRTIVKDNKFPVVSCPVYKAYTLKTHLRTQRQYFAIHTCHIEGDKVIHQLFNVNRLFGGCEKSVNYNACYSIVLTGDL